MASIKNSFKPLVDAIIFSNIWISLAALSVYLSVHYIEGSAVNYFGAVAIFTSTFIAYNFLKLKGLSYESNTSIFFKWIKKHKSFIYFLLILNALYFLYSFVFLDAWQQLTYFIALGLCILYFGINRFNLRKYYLLKIPLVALVWTILCAYTAVPFSFTSYNLLLASFVFALIAGLTIPFEIRDFNTDNKSLGAISLVGKLGINNTKYLAYLHLFLAFLFLLIINFYAVLLLPLFVWAAYLINSLNVQSSEYKYTLWLDGVLVLLFPFVYYAF